MGFDTRFNRRYSFNIVLYISGASNTTDLGEVKEILQQIIGN